MHTSDLFFWHFFKRLEKELGYTLSLEKYKLFRMTISQQYITLDIDEPSFVRFCKILLLQNYKDEARFEAIIKEAFESEIDIISNKIEQQLTEALAPELIIEDEDLEEIDETIPQNIGHKPEGIKTDGVIKGKGKETVTKYIHPNFKWSVSNIKKEQLPNKHSKQYILTKDYLPFTSRQLKKSWQYYRRKHQEGFTKEIDIQATIKKVAKDGFFLTPKYVPLKRNSTNTLLVLADFRGSMVPFHELSRKLIQTAKIEGGHAALKVYYFRNLPIGSVFKYSNLSSPVALAKVFADCNPNYTKAIIISDAGAVGMPGIKEKSRNRLKASKSFLKILNQYVHKTIWINPMPFHRWKNTTAEDLAKIVEMIPVLEQDKHLFLKAFKELS